MTQSKENYRRNWLKDLVAEREGLEAKLLAVSEPCASDIRYLGGYFPIKVNVLDRLLAIAKEAEKATGGDISRGSEYEWCFCPICGGVDSCKGGPIDHENTCPWHPDYPEIFGPWHPDYFPDWRPE